MVAELGSPCDRGSIPFARLTSGPGRDPSEDGALGAAEVHRKRTGSDLLMSSRHDNAKANADSGRSRKPAHVAQSLRRPTFSDPIADSRGRTDLCARGNHVASDVRSKGPPLREERGECSTRPGIEAFECCRQIPRDPPRSTRLRCCRWEMESEPRREAGRGVGAVRRTGKDCIPVVSSERDTEVERWELRSRPCYVAASGGT